MRDLLGRLTWRTWWVATAVVPLAVLAVFFAWPVAALFMRGFFPDGAWDGSGALEVLTKPRTWRILRQTLLQASVATALSLALGLPAAHVLYRRSFQGRLALRALVAIPFVLPTVVAGTAFRNLLDKNGPFAALELDGTMTAVVIAMVFFNFPLVVRSLGSTWAAMDDRPAQAAAALGARPARVFWTVTLPALAPAITSVASLVFLFCVTAFGIVLILGGLGAGTIETEIYFQTVSLFNLRAAAVLSIVQLVVVAGALYVSGRARARRERAVALRGVAGPQPRLGRADVPAVAVTSLGLFLIAAPIAQLVVRSLQRSGHWTVDNYADLFRVPRDSAMLVTVGEAALNSLHIAAWAALLAVTLGAAVSLLLARRPRRRPARAALALLDATFMLPLGVSAVTVGFGFLITLNRPPLDLRSSIVLIPIAQAIVAIPLVVRTVLPSLRAIDPRQAEAAAALGASPWRVLATIEFPVLVRALALAAGFALAVSLGEFGATSFLARPEGPTLPVMIFRLLSRPGAYTQGMAVAASVLLAVMTAAIMLLVEKAHPKEVSW
ncbi:iron ABC transporter permease [Buchananella felis]|uniref:ABC transporter permease n=1 Tax=Buchananella felis TaxID=3231492 RepID=UPI003527BCF2